MPYQMSLSLVLKYHTPPIRRRPMVCSKCHLVRHPPHPPPVVPSLSSVVSVASPLSTQHVESIPRISLLRRITHSRHRVVVYTIAFVSFCRLSFIGIFIIAIFIIQYRQSITVSWPLCWHCTYAIALPHAHYVAMPALVSIHLHTAVGFVSSRTPFYSSVSQSLIADGMHDMTTATSLFSPLY